MFAIFARSFMTAARSQAFDHSGKARPLDDRRDAETEARTTARCRD